MHCLDRHHQLMLYCAPCRVPDQSPRIDTRLGMAAGRLTRCQEAPTIRHSSERASMRLHILPLAGAAAAAAPPCSGITHAAPELPHALITFDPTDRGKEESGSCDCDGQPA
jgi:hypothetical protein